MRTWPSLARRAQPSARLLERVGLGMMLVFALAVSSRDGVPISGFHGVARHYLSGQPLYGLTAPITGNLSGWASTAEASIGAKALIPTAPPAMLLIAALNVHRPVEPVGANRAGVMDVPLNAWNAGWYKGGPVPGAPGDAVIEGHAGYPGQPMIFGRLGALRSGDQIVVVLSDGSRRLFIVNSMAVATAGKAIPGLADPTGPPRLTLITCTGDFDKDRFSYSKRLVVEASYAGVV